MPIHKVSYLDGIATQYFLAFSGCSNEIRPYCKSWKSAQILYSTYCVNKKIFTSYCFQTILISNRYHLKYFLQIASIFTNAIFPKPNESVIESPSWKYHSTHYLMDSYHPMTISINLSAKLLLKLLFFFKKKRWTKLWTSITTNK